MSRYLIIAILCFCVYPSSAQKYVLNWAHYGVEEGLSNRDVQDINQDNDGFIWIGTKYGLNRFDGYRFKKFSKEKNGLQSNEINNILKDDQGKLWLIYTGVFFFQKAFSIDIFDPTTEKSSPLENTFSDSIPFRQNEVIHSCKKKDGALAFLTSTKKLVTYSKGRFNQFPINIEPTQNVVDFFEDDNGFYWVLTLFQKFHNDPLFWHLQVFDQRGKQLEESKMQGIDFARIYYDPGAKLVRLLTAKNREVTPFIIDRKFNRILDSELSPVFSRKKLNNGGLSYLSFVKRFDDHIFIQGLFDNLYCSDIDFERTLPENELERLSEVTTIFKGRKNKLWIATQFDFFVWDVKRNPFVKLFQNENRDSRAVRGINADAAGNIVAIREYGRRPLVVKKDSLDLSINNIRGTTLNLKTAGFEPGGAYCLAKNKKGHFLGVRDGNLISFNSVGYVLQIKEIKAAESQYTPWAMLEDDNGILWMADDFGKILWVSEDSSGELPVLESCNGFCYVYWFGKTSDEQIWLATQAGLFVLDPDAKKTRKHYWRGGKGLNHLAADDIRHFYEDSDQSFWLATGGAGLIHWHPQTGEYKQFTTIDGLSDNTLHAVYADNFGYLWIPSDKGLMRFNKESHQVSLYFESDGITNDEFNRISHFQSPDGYMFFGGIDGVTAFNPADFLGDTLYTDYSLVLSGFHQFDGGEDRLVDRFNEVRESNTVWIKPTDRFFQMEFSLLDYGNSEKVQYAYKVEGVDENWIVQKEPAVHISGLPYGSHTLSVKGQAQSGKWSEKVLQLNLQVIRPFYLRPWFLAIATLFLLISGPSYYKVRTDQLKKRHAHLENIVRNRTKQLQEDKITIERQALELKELGQLKSRFFANVSHELRTPLSLVIGPVASILKRKKEGEEARLLQLILNNGKQLQKLINEILDLSKLEAGKLKVIEEPVLLLSFMTEQLAQFKSAATSEKRKLQFQFDLEEGTQILLDKSKFEKILHNYLSNALKFTPSDGLVKVRLSRVENDLLLSVKDNGKGIVEADLEKIFDRFYQSGRQELETGGTGIGLSMVKELAQLMGGKVWAESKLGEGSTFYYRFPEKPAIATLGSVEKGNETNEFTETIIATRPGAPIEPLDQSAAEPPGQGSGATLLIAEDNADLRAYLKFLLKEFDVHTAENGREALEKLAQLPECQLIISDLMMPVMNGFELLNAVKSADRWWHIPFIMLTAKVNMRAKLKALRIGVDDYLTKPFSEDELLARIRNLLRNYQQRRAFFSTTTSQLSEEEEGQITVINVAQSEWLSKLEDLVDVVMKDTQFNMDWAAQQLHLSQRQFGRRVKMLTGLTPKQYLQEYRLQMAKEYLLNKTFTSIKEVSIAIGLSDADYFSSQFKKRFGVHPSDHLH